MQRSATTPAVLPSLQQSDGSGTAVRDDTFDEATISHLRAIRPACTRLVAVRQH